MRNVSVFKNLAIRAIALIWREAFLQIVFTCSSKFSLSSIVTPSNFAEDTIVMEVPSIRIDILSH